MTNADKGKIQSIEYLVNNALAYKIQYDYSKSWGYLNDPKGVLEKVTLFDGEKTYVTHYEYNDRGLVSKSTSENETTEYSYDDLGNLIQEKDAYGNGVKYKFDAMRRLIENTEFDQKRPTLFFGLLTIFLTYQHP